MVDSAAEPNPGVVAIERRLGVLDACSDLVVLVDVRVARCRVCWRCSTARWWPHFGGGELVASGPSPPPARRVEAALSVGVLPPCLIGARRRCGELLSSRRARCLDTCEDLSCRGGRGRKTCPLSLTVGHGLLGDPELAAKIDEQWFEPLGDGTASRRCRSLACHLGGCWWARVRRWVTAGMSARSKARIVSRVSLASATSSLVTTQSSSVAARAHCRGDRGADRARQGPCPRKWTRSTAGRRDVQVSRAEPASRSSRGRSVRWVVTTPTCAAPGCASLSTAEGPSRAVRTRTGAERSRRAARAQYGAGGFDQVEVSLCQAWKCAGLHDSIWVDRNSGRHQVHEPRRPRGDVGQPRRRRPGGRALQERG